MKTVNQLIKELQSLKPELRDLPVVVVGEIMTKFIARKTGR